MKQGTIILGTLLLASLASHTLAKEAEYNIKSKTLSIPSVKIDQDHVYDAKLKYNDDGSFDLVGFSDKPSSTGGEIDASCTAEHITLEKFNQITTGMSVDQVNELLGCEGELKSASGTFSDFWWAGGGRFIKPLISVNFGNDGSFTQTYLP